jgi:tripartite-type tricarboxylate transporter receptor subunit TctC
MPENDFWEGTMVPRRKFLHLAVGAAALPALPRNASAQAYPTRPVRIIVGAPPGGGQDLSARLISQWLSDRLGQPFILEYRPGASTNIATEAVVRARPDGYTLLLAPTANANATLYDNLNFNFMRDIAPVAGIQRIPLIMEVHPSVPVTTIPEFLSYAKANPGKLSYGSAGIGTSLHVAGELFKMRTGISMIHVPYRGSAPALTNLLGGQIHVMFDTLTTSLEYVRVSKLRALAVTAAVRSEALPHIPTASEFLPGFEANAWFGLGAPASTPTAIIEALNREINAGLADPRVKARFVELGAAVLSGRPADFRELIADETEKWGGRPTSSRNRRGR